LADPRTRVLFMDEPWNHVRRDIGVDPGESFGYLVHDLLFNSIMPSACLGFHSSVNW